MTVQDDRFGEILSHLSLATGCAVAFLDVDGGPSLLYGAERAAPACAHCARRFEPEVCLDLTGIGACDSAQLCLGSRLFHICPMASGGRPLGALALGPLPAGDHARARSMKTMLRAVAALIRAEGLSPAAPDVFAQLEAYVRAHISEPLDFRTLSSAFFLSPDTLSRVTRRKTGMPLRRYIQSVRLEAARALLINTRLSVQEITGRCGFQDHNYFSRTFKKRYGCTPTALRRDG